MISDWAAPTLPPPTVGAVKSGPSQVETERRGVEVSQTDSGAKRSFWFLASEHIRIGGEGGVFLEEDLEPEGGPDICPVRRLETFRWLH